MSYRSYRPRIGGGGLWSMGRLLVSRISSVSRTSTRIGRSDGDVVPYRNFNEEAWEAYSAEIIDSQIDKAGNPGQETLLGEDYFGGIAKGICLDLMEDYEPNDFVIRVQLALDDTYYNAINEIIAECAEELVEVHEECINPGYLLVGGGRRGKHSVRFRVNSTLRTRYSPALSRFRNTFGSTMLTPDRVFSSSAAALSNYQGLAIRNFARKQPGLYAKGYAWDSYKASTARSRATARKFLRENPNGRPRNDVSWALTQNAFQNRYRP